MTQSESTGNSKTKVLLHSEVKELLVDKFISTNTLFGDLTLNVAKENLLEVVDTLKSHDAFRMDVLLSVTAVDYLEYAPNSKPEERFEVVYHFLSIVKKARLRVKVAIAEDSPKIPSLVEFYASANFMEREAWDMYGIEFEGHPDLRRILMYDEFKGHPLRKDYPLQGKQPRVTMLHPEVSNTARLMQRPELVQISKKQS